MRISIEAGSLFLILMLLFVCVTPKGNNVQDKRNYVLDMKMKR